MIEYLVYVRATVLTLTSPIEEVVVRRGEVGRGADEVKRAGNMKKEE